MNKKRFEDIDTSEFQSSKRNPFAKEEKRLASKTIRIYEEDYKHLRKAAFYAETSIAPIVEEGIALLRKKLREDPTILIEDNSGTQNQKNQKASFVKEKTEHKTIRIYKEDHKDLQNMAFEYDTTIVKLIEKIVKMNKEK